MAHTSKMEISDCEDEALEEEEDEEEEEVCSLFFYLHIVKLSLNSIFSEANFKPEIAKNG